MYFWFYKQFVLQIEKYTVPLRNNPFTQYVYTSRIIPV